MVCALACWTHDIQQDMCTLTELCNDDRSPCRLLHYTNRACTCSVEVSVKAGVKVSSATGLECMSACSSTAVTGCDGPGSDGPYEEAVLCKLRDLVAAMCFV